MKRIRKNLFRRGRSYYYRRQEDGRDRWISLETAELKAARERVNELETARMLHKAGIGERKQLGKRYVHLREVIARFEKAGFPMKNGSPRSEKAFKAYKGYADNLVKAIGNVRIDEFNASTWNNYTTNALAKGRGKTALDYEMVMLRSAFAYCSEFPNETGIKEKPGFAWVRRLQQRSQVSHCRDKQPDNAEQLHLIAAYFLNSPAKIAVMGWYVLFQAMTGQRRSETLRLRLDAKCPSDPGFDDGEHLWLHRSTTHKGTAPFIEIHPDLRELMTAHRQWVSEAFPGNPWYFPSPKGPEASIRPQAVSRGFDRVRRDLSLNKSTHGLRSYYVNVLRSQGLPDSEIALRIGHKSGGKLIVETYGEVLPIKLSWRPEGPPAWAQWTPSAEIAKPNFA